MTDGAAPAANASVPRFVKGFCVDRRHPLILVAAILASALDFIDGTVVASTMSAGFATISWVAVGLSLLSALVAARTLPLPARCIA